MAQQQRAQATRQRILEAAADVVQRKGYLNASLSDIVEAAGVTKGALYFHYRSKEDIAHAIVDTQHARAREGAMGILERVTDPLRIMLEMCHDLSQRMQHDPITAAGIRLTTDTTTFKTPVKDPYTDWMQTFAGLVRQGQAEGRFVPDIDPDSFGQFISPAYTGVQLVADAITGRRDLDARLNRMWKILVLALVPATDAAAARQLVDEVFGPAPEVTLP
ncbi:DNA-binding transcriptional regulator, AcrR family [Paramicrobacterium humi]|uniref:DNA-binding transcriptional regulator, AcrR family n=1 Tax=Paramicrobacterium humi TaxID=640635 RepID=A0A1H4LRL1_9MICO|nr:ScbR family autoregulator-binding transcription factor [Microbacterium humi]SEB73246.1 DNA-binding transcriptional regulator, AcrR family [Microbacterium humi]